MRNDLELDLRKSWRGSQRRQTQDGEELADAQNPVLGLGTRNVKGKIKQELSRWLALLSEEHPNIQTSAVKAKNLGIIRHDHLQGIFKFPFRSLIRITHKLLTESYQTSKSLL